MDSSFGVKWYTVHILVINRSHSFYFRVINLSENIKEILNEGAFLLSLSVGIAQWHEHEQR